MTDPGSRNDSRLPDARREACRELAESLETPAGLRTARLLLLSGAGPSPTGLSSTGLSSTGPSIGSKAPPGETSGPRPISIWQPEMQDGELVFLRPEPLPLGDHYAARRVLRARKSAGTRRVVLLGESVAAGYLYAPHLTCATVLEKMLGEGLETPGGYEVVDLARTNETLSHLVKTARSALQLEPDALVFFVGNNWNLLETPDISPYSPSVEGRQRYAQALAEAGPAGPARLASRELRAKANGALDELARLTAEAELPVIAILPEVNLADWESRQPVPWLPGDGAARWWRLFHGASEGLADGAWRRARALAEEMGRLDEGSVGTSFRLLAHAATGDGRLDEALWAARAEVDHSSYATLAFLDAPRATSEVREILRRAAARHGWGVVDLPKVFARVSEIPGRRLFLDYCHLSSEGLREAMAAVTEEVVRRLEGREVKSEVFRRCDLGIPAAVEATARFGAALHSAHRLLTVSGERPILEHGCREAFAASPAVAEAMLELITARASPCPAVLSDAQEANFASPFRLLLQHGWRWDFLDVELVEVICRVLEEAGRPVRSEVERLFVERRALLPGGCELAAAPYLWEPLERFYPEVMRFADQDERGTLRAPWPRSSFAFVHDGESAEVSLALTARLPGIEESRPREGPVGIRVNGVAVGRFTLRGKWTRARCRVGRNALRRGLNRVTLDWPSLPEAGDEALRSAIRRLELGQKADLHPVFGEVYSLWAKPATASGRGVDSRDG